MKDIHINLIIFSILLLIFRRNFYDNEATKGNIIKIFLV